MRFCCMTLYAPHVRELKRTYQDAREVPKHELRVAYLNRLSVATACTGADCTRADLAFKAMSTREELEELLGMS